MTNPEEALLPCPLCGSRVIREDGVGTDPSSSILHVAKPGGHNCPLADGVSDWNCEGDITALWNTRTGGGEAQPAPVSEDAVERAIIDAIEAQFDIHAMDPEDWAEMYNAIRAATAARPVQSEAVQWRPIESAPKDGTAILLYERDNDSVCEGRYVNDACRWYERNAHPTDAWDGEIYRPTHWRPLPAPPAPVDYCGIVVVDDEPAQTPDLPSNKGEKR